ncbi:RNA polymerase II large subunit CTD [Penicillium samsonianum]|uniref:RNA polymerase II large subunit CTD n=1 Tax=Penicillium samsonianum TaxID=1882272 RepID=UPI0025472FA6|nr:RNA polymerase II large subunit CTD [Penicillium samsonianum]KAJ6131942.1 RNA polymerase II large subunit CTD [Penicillium samsonianum]
MANHGVVILKAAFAACLLRPDPTSVPHDEISAFHTSLERALSHCSPANIQTCKAWLLRFVAFSSNRVGGLVNYLEALAASFPPPQPTGSKLSPKRQRLHILYLLNDLLHHCKYHLGTPATFSTVSGSLQLHLVNLVGYAATCDRQKNPRHHRRLDDLLDLWSEHEYFHPELVNKLREVVTMGVPLPSNDAANELNPAKNKNVPFIMPFTHGDPSTRWHEVRAGNIYPHIIPDSAIPIRPEAIKPIQLLAGPADAKAVESLKDFLSDVNKLFDPEIPGDDRHTDIDQLGQTVIRGRTQVTSSMANTTTDGPLNSVNPQIQTPRTRAAEVAAVAAVNHELITSADATATAPRASPSHNLQMDHDHTDMGSVVAMTHDQEAVLNSAHEAAKAHTHLANRPLHTSRPLTSLNTPPHPSAPSPLLIPPVDNILILPWVSTPAILKYLHPTTVLGLRLLRICRQCPSPNPDPGPRHQHSLLHTITILLLCRMDRTRDKTRDSDRGTACPRVSITSLLLILGVSKVGHGDLLLLPPRVGAAGNKHVHMKRCKSYV